MSVAGERSEYGFAVQHERLERFVARVGPHGHRGAWGGALARRKIFRIVRASSFRPTPFARPARLVVRLATSVLRSTRPVCLARAGTSAVLVRCRPASLADQGTRTCARALPAGLTICRFTRLAPLGSRKTLARTPAHLRVAAVRIRCRHALLPAGLAQSVLAASGVFPATVLARRPERNGDPCHDEPRAILPLHGPWSGEANRTAMPGFGSTGARPHPCL